ncbi:MAG: germination protein, partial [Paenibacillaceae bacterium]|nr:germination protein [Paenibacillaceae bacterium]
KTTLLPQTPREIVILVFVLLIMYFGRIGFESACRTNDIFFPLFVSTTLLLPLLLSNEINIHLLEPILVEPFSHLLESNLLSTGWYGDVFIAGAFLHTIASAQELKSSLRHGVIIGSLVLVLFLIMELSVLGWHTSSNLFYPNFTLIQQIHVTDFLDRVDLFLQGVWFFVICSKMIFIYLALLIAVQSFSKHTTYQLFNMPCAVFVIITSILAFRSTGAFFNFSNYGATIIALAYQPVVFLLLMLRAKMKKSKHSRHEAGAQADGNAGRQADGRLSEAEKKTVRTAKKWSRATILALLAAFAFFGFGILLGHVDAMYGKIASVGCGLCLLLLWLTTYKEMKWSVRHALK